MDFTGERFLPSANHGQEIEIEHVQRYRAILDLAAGKIILDAASGAGYGARILAESARLVCGIEIDLEAIRQAKDLYGDPRLTFVRGSVGCLPYHDGTFDLVVSFETIEHLPEALQREFLHEIKRVLKPGGILVMSTPDRRIYSDLPNYQNKYHLQEFYRDDFIAFLNVFFGEVRIWEQVSILSYLIANGGETNLRHIPVPGHAVNLHGKYLVALCSNEALPEVMLGCITLDNEGLHQRKIDRVVELQGEIEGKNQDIKNVWDEVHKRDATIAEMYEHTRNLEEKRDATFVSMLGQAQNLENNILAITKAISEKQQVNEQLLADLRACRAATETAEQERQKYETQLGHIYRSKAWRLIQKLYQLKNSVW